MRQVALLLLLWNAISCSSPDPITGLYNLEVEGWKNTAQGTLELTGETGDYFGKLTFQSTRERTYEVGLAFQSEDSLAFFLPGKGGYLRLAKNESNWTGKFKYFGIQADISAQKTGEVSAEIQSLVNLKPIGKDVISTEEEESFPCFDASNEILYFTRGSKIYSSRFSNSQWDTPSLISFSGDFNDSAPYLSPNGESMIFTSNRPYPDSEQKKKNLWISAREGNAWGEPSILPEPINIDSLGEYHGGIDANGNYYFASYNRFGGYGRSDLYQASLDSVGAYMVENLGSIINTDKSEADIFIDPYVRYLLFASTNREKSFGADDIYISFQENGIWSEPENLGPKVNSFAYEYGAWVDHTNGYLYFNSYRRGTSDIYRIKLEEIEAFNKL